MFDTVLKYKKMRLKKVPLYHITGHLEQSITPPHPGALTTTSAEHGQGPLPRGTTFPFGVGGSWWGAGRRSHGRSVQGEEPRHPPRQVPGGAPLPKKNPSTNIEANNPSVCYFGLRSDIRDTFEFKISLCNPKW